MERFESAKKAGIYGILGNIFLLVIKSFVGFASNSQAMIADAANSASDIFASLMTFIGNKIASEPSDKNHKLGHGKAEYIFSMFISISMMVFSFKILYDSMEAIIYKNQLTFSYLLVVVCCITIIVKFTLYIYTKKIYNKYGNLLIKSNMKDHRNDCIVTTFTLISVLLSLIGVYWFDGLVGLFISIWIFITGLKIFLESYNILMDISLDKENEDKILNIIKEYKEIKEVDDIYSTPTGYSYIVVFNIYIDGKMSTYESHKIVDDLQKRIIDEIDIINKVIIHVNPV